MKTIRATLKSISPYSQSRVVVTPKNDGESSDDHEKRTWRDRIHADSDGMVFISPMAFKKALGAAAKYESVKIPGKGNATYTKHVESGTLIFDPLTLDVRKDQVEGEWLFLDANGKKGKASSGRVMRCMPRIDHWQGTLLVRVIDETVLQKITRKGRTVTVLQHFLEQAGSCIGIGRFRPENGGFYGRFVVVDFEEEASDD